MKLLIVTEAASMHAARWVNQLKDTGWDVHVFNALVSSVTINQEFRFGDFHMSAMVEKRSKPRYQSTIPADRYEWLGVLEKKHPGLLQYLHEHYLINLINEWQPDVIHSLGLNINWENLCLPVLRALKSGYVKRKPVWLYSTWGADLDFFAKISAENYEGVQDVLSNVDCLVTESERDFRIAREMGFEGEFLGYFTGFGGVSVELLDRLAGVQRSSLRKTILLKGRCVEDGDLIGRAMTALKAFRLCEEELKDYRIVIGSASSSVQLKNEIELLKATTNLRFQLIPHLPYDMLMDIYASARLYISLTINDGIPSSILEAMTAGAFPVHSDLEPIRGLVSDRKSALLVNPEDVNAVADAIRAALMDNRLVDEAQALNRRTIEHRYSERIVRPKVIEMYETAIDKGHKDRGPKTKESCIPEVTGTIFDVISRALILNNEAAYRLISNYVEMENGQDWSLISRVIEKNQSRAYKIVSLALGLNKISLNKIVSNVVKTESKLLLVSFHYVLRVFIYIINLKALIRSYL